MGVPRRTRRRAAALLLAAMAGAARCDSQAAPASLRVGTVVSAAPRVEGLRNGALGLLGRSDPVWLQMEVATRERAGARIALDGGKGKDGALGALILGERSRVLFDRWVVEQGTRPEIGFRALLGDFLVFFRPRPHDLVTGTVQIRTPAGALVELHGTAIWLHVAAGGDTEVGVIEGEVTVRGVVGRAVQVPRGSWTEIAPGRAPRLPSPNDPRGGTLSPRAHGPAFNVPGERLIDDPPGLGPRGFLLDLPKARQP
jgi:hypothetical protein